VRRRLVALVATGCLLAGATSASTALGTTAPTAGADGIGDPYFPQDGNGGYDVVHYGIRDTMRTSSGLLTGTTTITARATKALSRFNLDLLLRVTGVTVDGRSAAWSRPNRHELQVTPATPIAAGQRFTVRVAHRGYPGSITWGGERSWFGNASEVVAMNEPHIAPWWFAANDHPRDKASYDIRIRVPRGQQVVANGRLMSRRTAGDWTTFHWSAADPMASYLAFFAAGRFTLEHGTTPSGVYYTLAVSRRLDPPSHKLALQLMRRTPTVQTWLEARLGRYPFRTSGGLTTSLPTRFALENQTRSTYPFLGGREADSIVAHELAHQWFGDSVSLRAWRDIWLNEGLAQYMETWWDHRGWSNPPRAMKTWLCDTYDDYGAEFWDLTIGAPGPARLFREEVYVRGAMTVQALRNRIGDADFRTLLRTWVSRHRYGNATTGQFEALAEQLSGVQLDGFFDAWLRTADAPAPTTANGLSACAT